MNQPKHIYVYRRKSVDDFYVKTAILNSILSETCSRMRFQCQEKLSPVNHKPR